MTPRIETASAAVLYCEGGFAMSCLRHGEAVV